MNFVLLHGFTGTPASWDAVRACLEGAGHRVVCPELLGHGAASDAASFEAEVDRVARALPRRGVLHLVGYSMGGRLALGLVTRHRVRFESLALISANPGIPVADESARQARRNSDADLAEQLRSDGITPFVERWESLPMWATQDALPDETRETQRESRLSHDPEALADALDVLGLAAMPDFRSELPDLDLPTKLIVGEHDEKYRAIATEMADALPDARVHVVPGVGHNVVLEAPDALATLLLDVP